MIGIVLAAGKGKRLRPLTETRPKVLLPVLDKPLIYRSLKLLKLLNIEKIVVVVSYLKEMVMHVLRSFVDELDIDIEFVDQEKELGTAHAVMRALNEFSDDAIIVYGDLYLVPEDISKILNNVVKRTDIDGVVTGVSVNNVSRYGKLVTDGEKVIDIIEKPTENTPGIANAGIYFFKKSILRYLKEIDISPRGEYELTDIIKVARDKGLNAILVKLSSDVWHDVGYPWDLLEVNKRELMKLKYSVIKGDIDRLTTIKGSVIIEEGSIVRGATYIEGPAYIGRDVIVGPNAYIRPYSVILDKAKIGFSVEVKESIVMEKTRAAHLAYIGDSIVGEEVNFGAGTVLANLRFDEKTIKVWIEDKKIDSGRKKLGAIVGGYVKTGINVSIMPGVKIGSYSIIYPGITVYRDVPPKTVVKDNWR